jgi:diguanylate cyclase (GGDEF)-like protein/PAS domain S-box-containing protein
MTAHSRHSATSGGANATLLQGGTSLHHRLRWAAHGALLVIALLLAAAGSTAWQAERRRAADAELINLAGAQRMLSQRVALLAPDWAADNGSSLQGVLQRARREAQRIEALLGIDDPKRFAALPDRLQATVRQWQAARSQLWSRAAHAPTPVRAEADVALQAAEDLVSEIQRHAEAKSADALRQLALVSGLGAALLLALGGLGVEPAVRFVRRLQLRLTGQAAQLERLALVAERTRNAVIITDAARRIVWANEAFSRVSGYSLAEALGRKPSELLQTEVTDAATVTRLREALDAGLALRVELLNRSKAGRDYWLDMDIQPLHDASGHLSGFIAVETDITEQVCQRLRLRALLDALPTGVVEQDASGAIVEANLGAERMLGLTRDQLLGRSSMDPRWRSVHDDLSPYPGDQHPIMRSLREGVSVRGDSMGVITPSGEQHWLLVNSEPLRSQFGSPTDGVTGAVACFIDVTEQRAQRTLLKLALQVAEIGTWQWHVDSGEREWSAASCHMLGYTVEEFQPLLANWRERIHPDDRPRVEALLRLHMADPGVPYRSDMPIRHRDGRWIWVQTLGAVVERDADGQAQRMVGVYIDIGERKRHEHELRANALTDALTGLPNRAAVLHQLQAAIARRRSDPRRHFALLFLDFDRFKQVNDSLGHPAGDELLRQIAQRLQATLRPGDALGRAAGEPVAARLGGDEFVVVLDGLHQVADACVVAERLLGALSRPYDVHSHRLHSSASIGIVDSDQPFDGAESLLRDADTAMYEAKRSGRGRWVLFEPHLQAQARGRAGIEADLDVALERDEVFVVYQPLLALDDPRGERGCVAVEALARWRHPGRGMVAPIQFIPIAEESGLIGALGLFVLESACRQFMRWRLDLGERAPALLAVNLSMAQLRQSDLVARVERTLADCAMPAAALQLEITESLAAQDPLAQARLRELKAMGVRLALDDFGTGYSSLACLQQLPVDTVKIDRALIVEAERSDYHRALIDATVRVARTLRMTIVAEGIETVAQAALITDLGCDHGQGYLYCRPLEADALTAWLAARALRRRALVVVPRAKAASALQSMG